MFFIEIELKSSVDTIRKVGVNSNVTTKGISFEDIEGNVYSYTNDEIDYLEVKYLT